MYDDANCSKLTSTTSFSTTICSTDKFKYTCNEVPTSAPTPPQYGTLSYFAHSIIVKSYTYTDCDGPVQYTTGYVKNECVDDSKTNGGFSKYVCSASNNSPSYLFYANSNLNSATCESSPTTTALSTTCTK